MPHYGFFVGHIYPELVEENVGESEIKKCHYLGTSDETEEINVMAIMQLLHGPRN